MNVKSKPATARGVSLASSSRVIAYTPSALDKHTDNQMQDFVAATASVTWQPVSVGPRATAQIDDAVRNWVLKRATQNRPPYYRLA